VLNHMLVSWDDEDDLPGDLVLYEPDEIADARGQGLEPGDVPELRPEEERRGKPHLAPWIPPVWSLPSPWHRRCTPR